MAEVTVVVPAYNAGRYLKPAVDSLLGQDFTDLEIIVVDDGSTDGSIATVEGLPIRVVRQRNNGEAAARNAGIHAATAPLVTFLDADDVLVPGSISARRDFLLAQPTEAVVGGLPGRLIDERGEVVAAVFERMAAKHPFPFRLTAGFYHREDFFPASCSLYLYRREVFDSIGLFDETLAVAPDWDLHLRLLKTIEIPIVRVPTFDRRIHATNLSLASAQTRTLAFREETLAALRFINRRHGLDPKQITPWELEYL